MGGDKTNMKEIKTDSATATFDRIPPPSETLLDRDCLLAQ